MKNANPVSNALRAGLLLLAMLVTAACSRTEEANAGEPKTVQDWFAIRVGGQTLQMQLAVRNAEMQHGLMGRTDLAADQGMLFVYAEPSPQSFWMRNTPTALDIGFFTSDGVLREVYPLFPYDETPVKSQRSDLQYALEVKQGGFRASGIKIGDRLDLGAVTDALQARGFDPRRFRGLGN